MCLLMAPPGKSPLPGHMSTLKAVDVCEPVLTSQGEGDLLGGWKGLTGPLPSTQVGESKPDRPRT